MGEEKGKPSQSKSKKRKRKSPRTASPGTGGSATRLTQQVWEELVKYTGEGLPLVAAAQLAGVSRRTVSRWLERGRNGEKRFKDFWRDMEKARGRAHRRAAVSIQVAIRDGTWQAAAWWLERNYPELYARREGGIGGASGEKLEIVIRDETEDAGA